MGSSLAIKKLRYTIPETDAVAFYASCKEDDPSGTLVEVYTSFGDRKAGQDVTLQIGHAGGSSTYAGSIFVENEEYAGSRFVIPKDDPLWISMANSPEVSFGIKSEQQATVSGTSGAAALNEFSQQC